MSIIECSIDFVDAAIYPPIWSIAMTFVEVCKNRLFDYNEGIFIKRDGICNNIEYNAIELGGGAYLFDEDDKVGDLRC